MTFGERIVFYRSKKNINQKQLAQILNITPTRLNYWEKDKRQPDVAMIKALSEALEVSPDVLIGNATEDIEPTKNSPNPEGSREQISMDESNRLFDALVNAGLIDDSMNFSEADGAFFNGIAQLINAWVMSHRR